MQANLGATPETDAAEPPVEWIEVGRDAARRRLAMRMRSGNGPAVLWLGGFRSTMESGKATALDRWGAEFGRAVVRFDYSGHGRSEGRFEDGSIGAWLEEAEAAFARCGPRVIVVGSSMGGWIALLLARRLRARGRSAALAGMVLIAPATDFTARLIEPRLTPAAREALARDGVFVAPSQYDHAGLPITRLLLEESRSHLLYGGTIAVGCPIEILQGCRDAEVPWKHALELVEHLAGDDVVLTLVKDGDHRLSRPEDLDRLIAAVERMSL